MAETVDMSELETKISQIMKKYETEAERATKECVQKVARAGVSALKGVSTRATGAYSGGWKAQTTEGRMGATATLHNAKRPGLAHLLEHGHGVKNQYGAFGRTSPIVHIAPVEQTLCRDFENQIRIDLGAAAGKV